MKTSFNTLVMIYGVVLLVAVSTWILPGGEFERVVKDGKTMVVPGSFTVVASQHQGIGALLVAPVKGFVQAAQIIAFLFVIGGAFAIIQRTGAIAASVQHLAESLAARPGLRVWFIPVTMIMFSLGGSVFGMCEETMPFVLIFIPLALSLGYDSIVGVAIPFLGAAAGFAGSTLNPFTVGIAQSIAELPLYSGLGFRVVVWLISTTSVIVFVMRYGSYVRQDPSRSVVHDIDQHRRETMAASSGSSATLTTQHKLVLATFIFAIGLLVYGILAFKWYINEIAALFLALGIVAGIVGGSSLDGMTESFREGARDMIGVALIIGCARAILVVAQDGKVLDVMLYSLAAGIHHLNPILAAQTMFVAQGIINFFVHSGSGQAALTMPIMAPLADAVGLTRQTAVLAFQFGEGWINPVLPTSGVTMGVLGLAGIPWERWFRWMLPAQIYFLALAFLLLALAVVMLY